MEVMVDTEAIAMARERLKMMPSQAKEVMLCRLWFWKKLWQFSIIY